MVDVEQPAVVGVEVGADLRMDARGACALLAGLFVLPFHPIHVGRWSAEVAKVAFEVGHLRDLFHLPEYALLASAGNELALMSTDGTEGTSAEASPMDVDRKLNHLVSRDAFVLVFGVGQAGVWEVERCVELFCCHGGIGRIDHHHLLPDGLQQSMGVDSVALFFDVPEVLCL